METILECKICEMAANENLVSALGSSPICEACFFANAERPEVIHEAVRELTRQARELSRDISSQITCYAEEGLYLPLKEWEDRVSRQIPAVVDPEEDDLIEALMDKVKALSEETQWGDLPDAKFDKAVATRRFPSMIARWWSWIWNAPMAA